jgi:hypothetical protein
MVHRYGQDRSSLRKYSKTSRELIPAVLVIELFRISGEGIFTRPTSELLTRFVLHCLPDLTEGGKEAQLEFVIS